MTDVRTVLMTTDTVGGVFTYALTLSAELAKRGIAVHLATMGAALRPEQRAAADGVPGLVVHESTYALEWMDDPWDDVERAGRWLLALEREVDPDIVHVNGLAHGALPFGAPRVVVVHSCVLSWWEAVLGEPAPARYDRYRREVALGLERADAVIAVSGAMVSEISRLYGVRRPYVIVHNGVAPAPTRSATKEPFVLSCGRLWDHAKNVAMLARVASRLSWPVKIAGWNGNEQPNVECLGWLGPNPMGILMERASIFALPARYEPFGLAPVEAALRGSALVLGDIPSLREIWGDAALFVDPADENAVHAAIERLSNDDDLRGELASKAHDRAVLYPASRMAERVLDVYALATAAFRSGPERSAGGLAQEGAVRPCA